MFGMGMWELVVIAIVALLALGPEKLPEAAKTLSKGIRDFRRQTRELQETLEDDHELGDAIRDLKSALHGEDVSAQIREREARRKAAREAAVAQKQATEETGQQSAEETGDPAATTAEADSAAHTTASDSGDASAPVITTGSSGRKERRSVPTILPAANIVAKGALVSEGDVAAEPAGSAGGAAEPAGSAGGASEAPAANRETAHG